MVSGRRVAPALRRANGQHVVVWETAADLEVDAGPRCPKRCDGCGDPIANLLDMERSRGRVGLPRRVNGRHVVVWEQAADLELERGPRCPKHCDTATPPEPAGRGRWVCVCCGTEFTWKGQPS